MLPAAHRLTDAASYQRVLRRGRRSRAGTLVVSLAADDDAHPVRVGLVVSRAVGNSVQRNLVKRRLRHLMLARISDLPSGSSVVLRALPGAAAAPASVLARDLDRGLDRVRAGARA